ncbi:MAG TPA: ABC transporter substrate-binding protein [Stellaceae bacterium]|nr:ABC transporter substrate-binding protein [Stellaceae bacterium]
MRGTVLRALALASCAFASHAAAEAIKVGIGTGGVGHLFVAKERGYFAAEGLDVEFVPFVSAEPVAVAVASGAIEFGATGLSGALYGLGAQGVIRIVAGSVREAPGFKFLTIVESNRAYEAGWKSLKDLGGHSVAVPQIGSPSHYSVALAAEKYGVDLKTVRVLPVQSVANAISAATGGQADAAVMPLVPVMPSIARGDVRLMAYVGDETPWQIQAVFATAKTATDRHDMVEAFLRAYRKGAKEFHDAFTGPDGARRDGPEADAILAIMAKYMNQTVEQAKLGVPAVDAEGRLDVKDVLHQIAWYKAQNMLKGDAGGDAVIDQRYVVALPER